MVLYLILYKTQYSTALIDDVMHIVLPVRVSQPHHLLYGLSYQLVYYTHNFNRLPVPLLRVFY